MRCCLLAIALLLPPYIAYVLRPFLTVTKNEKGCGRQKARWYCRSHSRDCDCDCGSKIFLKCFFRGRLFEVIFEHFCRNHHPPPYSFGYTVGASIRLRHRWIGNDRLYKTAASNRIEFSFFHFISDSPDSKQR